MSYHFVPNAERSGGGGSDHDIEYIMAMTTYEHGDATRACTAYTKRHENAVFVPSGSVALKEGKYKIECNAYGTHFIHPNWSESDDFDVSYVISNFETGEATLIDINSIIEITYPSMVFCIPSNIPALANDTDEFVVTAVFKITIVGD